jgi:Asp-tRNA(Asn)/Glu-tRNA(Gln) amidotransferase A subunit family amidase
VPKPFDERHQEGGSSSGAAADPPQHIASREAV